MLWGGNVIGIKAGLETFPPFWSAFWRMLLGLPVLLIWAGIEKAPLQPSRRDVQPLALLGVLFAVQISLLNFGTEFSSPAYAVVLVNANPIFANLIGHFVPFEPRLRRKRVIGLAIAFLGLCWVILGEPDERLAARPLLGNILTTVSACALGVRMLYTRHLVQSIPPVRAIVWQIAISLPLFLAMALILEPPLLQPVAWPAVAAVVYTGTIVAGFCFLAWASLLRHHSAGTLSMFSFTIPFFGILLSALLFGEPISTRLVAGAVVVTAGIVVVTRA
jgi:drug/metabolite transporter (DMT)-like permease